MLRSRGERKRTRRNGAAFALRCAGQPGQRAQKTGQLLGPGPTRQFLQQAGDLARCASRDVQASVREGEEIAEPEIFRESPERMARRKVPLHGDTARSPPRVPVMREVFPEQHKVARSKGTDVVANETRSFPGGKKRQLHLHMEVPVGPFPRRPQDPTGREHTLHVAQRMLPAEHPKRVPCGNLNVLSLASHRDFHNGVYPAMTTGMRQ